MLATSVFLFRRTFHFDPFIKRENDNLEITLKSLAARKIFLVYKKAWVCFPCPALSHVASSTQIFVAGRVYSCWKRLPWKFSCQNGCVLF